MSLTHDARGTASRAANSKSLELLARAGFIGYGVLHLLLAWLALQVAFGNSSGENSQAGALEELAAQSFGAFLVGAIGVGLVAMAIWQALEAAVGHQAEQGKERLFERLVSVGRALTYLYFAYTAYKVVSGANASNADSSQQLTEKLMDSTGGRLLVGVAGLAVLAIGLGMIHHGWKKKFEDHLKTGEMSPTVRKAARRLGMAGYVAKGIAYGIAGFLVITAAVTYDSEKARGLDAALRTLVEQSYGPILLTLVALGIAAYGAYCFVQFRYRKV
ncbi:MULTISPECIES: DUF1206 domain-containing protein [Catenuloplanes]|uniref:Type IV secretory pathway VirB2 component (Pilin) n=1 Tax=Catenuloplanes niger TaxID=587534 RepID=A0AAE3ZVH6_9ACTN|nr:DUF1206 domain-containing protein [Catenuloplanes niger]MDR7325712.1 type IV secretory pathway VirB2 component (pilin) [Catenuloplanes niger]